MSVDQAVHRRALTVLMFAAIGIATMLSARADEPDPDESLLMQSMEAMGEAYSKLRRQIGESSMNEASLKLVSVMQASALAAIGHVPPKAESLPAQERPKFILGYKRAMVELLAAILDLEEALLDADNGRARKAHKKLGTLKRRGHGKFQEED